MKVLVAQLGARRHYAVPRALAEHDMLSALVTDFCADAPPLSWLRPAIPEALRKGAIRRVFDRRAHGVPKRRIHSLIRFAMDHRNRRRPQEPQTVYWARRNAAFARAVAVRGFTGASAVYAFNGAALEIFTAAKRNGLECVLDQTAAPWRHNSTLLHEEQRRWPQWELEPAEIDAHGLLSEREEAEWALADVIVCGSQFAADALAQTGGPRAKCIVVPYGGHAPSQLAGPPSITNASNRKLRVLTAGTLQLRKGVPYLLGATRHLSDHAEFRWLGKNLLSAQATAQIGRSIELTGHVPRSAVWQHFAWADVFVLPTISEGSANVVYEAMAAGLPVITTPNAGSIVEDGVTGLIVPARDNEALSRGIRQLLENPEQRHRLACAAQLAAQRLSLSSYGERLKQSLDTQFAHAQT